MSDSIGRIKGTKVAVVRIPRPEYPNKPPFHPSQCYEEYPFAGHLYHEPNEVYDGVRRLFISLGLDSENLGTPDWNPLQHTIEPGMTVVLKPNFVLSRHSEGKDLFSIITHPSVIRAIADYCWIALKGHGRLCIADAPQYNCNFQEILEHTGLSDIKRFYERFKGPRVEILDLRNYWSKRRHFPSMLIPLPGDPLGSLTIDLNRYSMLIGKRSPEKFYGAVYHRKETFERHSGNRQEYEISRTIMSADAVISIPKLKVHKKVGVTLNAKGLVGIATNKNLLVHYTLTSPSEGGDQYPDNLLSPMEDVLLRIERWMYDHLLAPRKRLLEYIHRSMYWIHHHTTSRLGVTVDDRKRLLDAGNWYGNDTAWRMTVDLVMLFYFTDTLGAIGDTPQRRFFSVIDGIIGGENKGPLTPDPKPCGTLLAGDDLIAVDLVGTRLMGFDPLKLKIYRHLLENPRFGIQSLEDIQVVCDHAPWRECLSNSTDTFLNFRPYPGWLGHIEIQPKKGENVL